MRSSCRGTAGHALALCVVALLACKPKSKVDGTVTLNGAAFAVKDCSVGKSTSSFGGGSTTSHFVTLIDGAGNRIQLTETQGDVRVSYFTAGGGAFADVGQSCGTLGFTTPPGQTPAAGTLSANCSGSGYHVVANARFEGCGTYGL